ncbi:hypothetical protein [Microbacterium rhizomatis]|uniref:Uncharacterized protein n=1 Tax=Microbacterium rhizomatis TaxID=1631477 RepID=A0A5J5J294_9MICO|nr:hypothetical protein [Microbacterium rhizomatis]KAA9110170.1 hypothetical protein F6B43_00210 [Microbacterium rhizomatis]
MSEPVLIAVLTLSGVALTALGAVLGHLLSSRTQKRAASIQAEANKSTADNALIDQLQEELGRYRDATDKRLDRLETENRGYRAFLGVQRDHMAAHGVPLPEWPDGLPR